MTFAEKMLRVLHPYGMTVIVCLVAYLLAGNKYLFTLEERLEQLWYVIHSECPAESRVVVVEIDDATFDNYEPQIPIPRDQIALLVNDLVSPVFDARTVILDLHFEGPDRYDQAYDTLLAYIISEHSDRVVNAAYLPISVAGFVTRSPVQCLERFSYNNTAVEFPFSGTPQLPLPILLCASKYCGHIDIFHEESSVFRSLPLFVGTHNDIAMAALSLEGLRNYLGIASDDVVNEGGYVRLGEHRIPIDEAGTMNIKYFRSRDTHQTYSMLDIFEESLSDSPGQGHFKDKIVLVGINSATHFPRELSTVPYGYARPNVYLHADLITGILNDSYLRDAPKAVLILFMLVVSGWFVMIRLVRRRLSRVAFGLAILLVFLAVDFLLFQAGYIAEVMPPLVAGIILSLYTGFYAVEEQKEIIEKQALEVGELKEKEKSLIALERELQVARAIQENLLPREIPPHTRYEFYGINIPAQEVSGDLYDYIELPDKGVAVTLGDVSGKGISAAMLMATTQAVIRSETLKHQLADFSCAELVTRVNRLICASTQPGTFVTLFYCLLDAATNSLQYVNAGHNCPLVVAVGREPLTLDTGGLILGVVPDTTFESGQVTLHKGQKVVLYTDGITEALNRHGDMFEEERFEMLLRDNSHLSAKDLGEKIVSEVTSFTDGARQSDDITLAVIGTTI